MKINVAEAFANGNKGLSIWKTAHGYQVGVKRSDGSFTMGIDEDLHRALDKALGRAPVRRREVEDLA